MNPVLWLMAMAILSIPVAFFIGQKRSPGVIWTFLFSVAFTPIFSTPLIWFGTPKKRAMKGDNKRIIWGVLSFVLGGLLFDQGLKDGATLTLFVSVGIVLVGLYQFSRAFDSFEKSVPSHSNINTLHNNNSDQFSSKEEELIMRLERIKNRLKKP